MNQLATQHKQNPLAAFAEKFNIEPQEMERVLKSTCFRQKENVTVTNEQMVALLAVAQQYDLNPFLKQIYAFPDKSGGIVPVVGIDGWLKIINKHPQYDGMEIDYADDWVRIDEHAKPCPAYMTVTIHRKDRKHSTPIREDLDECYKAPFVKNNYTAQGPWQTHPKRFLRHKAIIQAARVVFNITGIYDEDEAQNIIEREINPDFQSEPMEGAPVEEVSVSQTDNIVRDIQSRQSQNPIKQSTNEPSSINEEEGADKKEEKTDLDKPKKMTVKIKNDLLKQIEQCFSNSDLMALVPEFGKYEEKSVYMMELRDAWKTKQNKIKDAEKSKN